MKIIVHDGNRIYRYGTEISTNINLPIEAIELISVSSYRYFSKVQYNIDIGGEKIELHVAGVEVTGIDLYFGWEVFDFAALTGYYNCSDYVSGNGAIRIFYSFSGA
ncbi:hypothetical protein [Salidesulfovibrio onnuriiensis]|uniref:hypothetical protein n=1 Tax=Salidesulfovibrio onnuriiensis TaxID=2583823 RepID=UPI0011C72499|nr:hypothetical protein [Salidesulfovibrio onnuriiensis]